MHPIPLRRVDLRLDIPLPLYSDLTHLTRPCFPSPSPSRSSPKDNTSQSHEAPILTEAHEVTTLSQHENDAATSPSKPPHSPVQTLFEDFYNMSGPSSPTSTPNNVFHLPFNLRTTPFSPILNDILETPTYLYSLGVSPTSAQSFPPVFPPKKHNLSRSYSHPETQAQGSTPRMHRSSSFNSSHYSRAQPSTIPFHPHPQPKPQTILEEHKDSQSPTVWAPTLPFSVQPLPSHCILTQ